ncbi:MAG TPA: AAA family ATPase, partial [Chthonomonadaceae bacterium]|nr:AAA family ATPase [Chthonomonadaceae bacterium]
DQTATKDAFDALHYLADIRLRRRKLVVIDATNVQEEARKPLLEVAARNDALAVAIVLDIPERLCRERNRERADRNFGPHVLANQGRNLRQSLRTLKREGFHYVFTLNETQVEGARVVRAPLWTDRRQEQGPFDIIGDIHGCHEELTELLGRLGYAPEADTAGWRHPEGRRIVFVGDLVDRGPKVVETVRLAQTMVAAGTALCVPGNHDIKLMRALKGNPVKVAHGLAESLAQIEALPETEREAFTAEYIAFADSLVSHYWLEEGRLCVAHAGMKESYIGRGSSRVRSFALYGDTTGESDAFGLPVRYPWAQDYRGATTVVYGHTPVSAVEWINNTVNLDTGCVFGGRLSALRWPEREIVQVPARATYAEPIRPPAPSPATSAEEARTPGSSLPGAPEEASKLTAEAIAYRNQQRRESPSGELLRAEDVLGKRILTTRLLAQVIIPAANAAAALETMSRFAVEPRWLIYLPPTMSPCETARSGDALERPQEAFTYYREQGVEEVVCQRKHMGSRAVMIVCRDEEVAQRRFGGADSAPGQCYTRTGRQFFDEPALQTALLQEASAALTRAGFWEAHATDWACLDCELMPWNAKAQGLLCEQYAPVGAAAHTALPQALEALTMTAARGLEVTAQQERLRHRLEDVKRYIAAYGRYCWETQGLEGIRLAPFHLLATEGRTYFDRDHTWHTDALAALADHSALFQATESLRVLTADEASQAAGAAWWKALTEAGGEGMVVKP